MIKVWAKELCTFGITCNTIIPGTLTDAVEAWKNMDPDGYQESLKPQSITRLGNPQTDIAPTASFLASEESRFLTAIAIRVDGGTTKY